MKQKTKDLIKISLFANAFEWYDFTIVAFMAFYIGKLFFNVSNPYIALSAGFLTFSLSYIVRPIGAFIFGLLAKNLSQGRILNISMLTIAIPSVIIGILPTYSSIGVYAPIILILLRLIQGLGTGGESPSAISYMYMQKHLNKLFVGIAMAGTIITVALASLVVYINDLAFHNSMLEWAWRVPFWFSIPFTLFVLYMRKKIVNRQISINKTKTQSKTYFIKKLIHSWFIYSFCNTTLILVYFWYPIFIHLPTVKLASTIGLIFISIGMMLGGIKSLYNYLFKTTIVFLICILIFYIPMQWNIIFMYIGFLIIGLLLGIIYTQILLKIATFFVDSNRLLGIALAIGIPNAYIASTSPAIISYLSKYSENAINIPLIYITFLVLISIIIQFISKKTNFLVYLFKKNNI